MFVFVHSIWVYVETFLGTSPAFTGCKTEQQRMGRTAHKILLRQFFFLFGLDSLKPFLLSKNLEASKKPAMQRQQQLNLKANISNGLHLKKETKLERGKRAQKSSPARKKLRNYFEK